MPSLPGDRKTENVSSKVTDGALLRRTARELLRFVTRIRRIARKGLPAEGVLKGSRLVNLDVKVKYHKIRLKMRRDNHYIIGYQRNASEVWEMRHSGKGRLKKSKALGFNESYSGVKDVTLSFESFKNAILHLIKEESPHRDHKKVKSNIFTLVVSMIETACFGWIMETLYSEFARPTKDPKLEDWIDIMIHNWKRISFEAAKCDEEIVVLTDEELAMKLSRDINKLLKSPRLCKDCLKSPWICKDCLKRF